MLNEQVQTPPGMLERLISPRSRVVMIKGAAGTGRTSLGARLLQLVGEGTYVSATRGPIITEPYPAIQAMRSTPKFSEISLKGNESLLSPGMIRSLQKGLHAEGAITVFDSWNSITSDMTEDEKKRAERTVVDLARDGKSRVVFIIDGVSESPLEFLCNSIVTLSARKFGGGRIRELEWDKLPDAVPFSNSLFTIRPGGVFYLIPSAAMWKEAKGPYVPTPNTDTHFSTGSPDLDALFGGGLKRGSLVLLEVGDDMSMDWYTPILTNMGVNFILDEGCAIVLPSVTILPEMLMEQYRAFMPTATVEKSLRVLTNVHLNVGRISVTLTGDSPQKDFDTLVDAYENLKIGEDTKRLGGEGGGRINLKGEKKERACFINLNLSTWEAFHKEFDTSLPAKAIFRLKTGADLLVLVAHSGARSMRVFSDACDYHAKLVEVDGSLVIYATRPTLQPHAIFFDDSAGRPEIKLVPIF